MNKPINSTRRPLSIVLLLILIAAGACTQAPPPAPPPLPPAVQAPVPGPDEIVDDDLLTELPYEAAPELPSGPLSVYDRMLQPFVKEAERARVERAKTDAEFNKRVDKALNDGRVNFLIFGYGETHEPPRTERAIIGSITMVSYNLKTRAIDLVSLTHDIRAPEVERYKRSQGVAQRFPLRIDQAWFEGGSSLLKTTVESATGLAVDFEITLPDSAIADFVDGVLGGVAIDVPSTFTVNPFYLKGVKYPEATFAKGPQTFDGKQVIQYIKTVPVENPNAYNRNLEHNARKHQIARGMLAALKSNAMNPLFYWKMLGFLNRTGGGEAIEFDFDMKTLLFNNFAAIAPSLGSLVVDAKQGEAVPEVRRTIYIHDPKSGDGGVQWIRGSADINPITRRDVAAGLYPDMNLAIPVGANPGAADLVTGYWAGLRQRIRLLLR